MDRPIEIAEETSINLVIENSTNGGYQVQTERLLSKRIDLNLDIGHWFAGGHSYEEFEELIISTKERILLFHIHDVRFEQNFTEDHLPLDQGSIDFIRVFNILKKGKLKWMNLEVHLINQNRVKAGLLETR